MTFDPTRPRFLLRIEGAAVLVVALLLYRELGASWLTFAVLFLLPDISILAYLGGARSGGIVYNAVHTYLIPAGLYAIGFAAARPLAMALGLIWAAHIGFDRFLGFGLKYSVGFRETHLHRT